MDRLALRVAPEFHSESQRLVSQASKEVLVEKEPFLIHDRPSHPEHGWQIIKTFVAIELAVSLPV